MDKEILNRELLEKTYKVCKEKFEVHMKKFTVLKEYGAVTDGNYYVQGNESDFYGMSCWMASFITGLAPVFYRTEKDEKYIKWAEKFNKDYRDKIFEHPLDTMHDLGFLYSPYCVAMYQLTGEKIYRESAVKAADELLKRFDIHGKYIEAWQRMDSERTEGRAIIDCMMNLALLLWAWKETGHTIYYDIAAAHADTTIKYFVREDASVAHSYMFDRITGEMTRENNDCGYGNGSHWARGTAWAVYGFAIAWRYTGNELYYETAVKLAEKYIESVEKYIPIWDFRLPKELPAKKCNSKWDADWDESDEKYREYIVDTSAAAVFADGLYELISHRENKKLESFLYASLQEICQNYINQDKSLPGILMRQNGCMTYTTYGDYYMVEVLQRVLYDTETCW